jgi:type IV pilus assembly protein PilM
MPKLLRSNYHSTLGVDISATSVKIVEISGREDHRFVEEYGSAQLPLNAMDGHTIKNVDAIAQCIKQILARSNFTSKFAALAVPDTLVFTKTIQINDGLTDDEIEELVIMEADKYIPYPIDEVNFDFSVLGPSLKNVALLDVLIVATRSENINRRVEALTKAGLQVNVVDVESFAVERITQLFVRDLPISEKNKIIAVIIIGSLFAHLFVLNGMKIIFTREEEFGGKQLIDAIAHHYDVTYFEALRMKEQNDMPANYEQEVLNPFVEKLLQHVKRTLQFFFTTKHYNVVDKIFLAGKIADLPNLAHLIEEKIKIATSVIHLFDYIPLSKKIKTTTMTSDEPPLIACGLALRT